MIVHRRPPLRLLLHLADHRRHRAADMLLAVLLAFVAGGINAGGFLAVGRYTSHMTGYVSELADSVAIGAWGAVVLGIEAVGFFMLGAAGSAILINWARRHTRLNQYALPLLVEAGLLCLFALGGVVMGASPEFALVAVPLLCLTMGLQNATITKLSGARMRTTHVTGLVTDIGIELGKAAYWNRDPAIGADRDVKADRSKLLLLSTLVAAFCLGGLTGAIGFTLVGFGFAAVLAVLLALAVAPRLLPRRRRTRRRLG